MTPFIRRPTHVDCYVRDGFDVVGEVDPTTVPRLRQYSGTREFGVELALTSGDSSDNITAPFVLTWMFCGLGSMSIMGGDELEVSL